MEITKLVTDWYTALRAFVTGRPSGTSSFHYQLTTLKVINCSVSTRLRGESNPVSRLLYPSSTDSETSTTYISRPLQIGDGICHNARNPATNTPMVYCTVQFWQESRLLLSERTSSLCAYIYKSAYSRQSTSLMVLGRNRPLRGPRYYK